jgi:hypothetical protein
MKTISLTCDMNVTFKKVQPLPALTSAMLAGEPAPRATHATYTPLETQPETRATTPPGPARQLPRASAVQGPGEPALFAVLGLSAVFCLGQTLATMVSWPANAPQLTAWIAQWLG